jgi:peptidoglycan hydrolase FlgJ
MANGSDLLSIGLPPSLSATNRINVEDLKAKAANVAGDGNKTPQVIEKEKEAAKEFEALLVHQMLQSMYQTVSTKDSLLGSPDEEKYRDLYLEALSKDIADGQGIGIKEVISKEFSKRK